MANLIFPKIEEPYVLTKPKSAKKMANKTLWTWQDMCNRSGNHDDQPVA